MNMNQLLASLPTYTPDSPDGFDVPMASALVRLEEGVRVVLGTHDYADGAAADVLIERHKHGWLLHVKPVAAGDPSGFVALLDDGRTVFVKDPYSNVEFLDDPEKLVGLD